MSVTKAVIFDMDGMLVDSESVWHSIREQLAREIGGTWTERAQHDMMGMSSRQWPRYMHEQISVPLSPDQINLEVVARLTARYRERLPLIPGSVEAVRDLAERWPLAVASSSNKPLIELVLELAGLVDYFQATVSSEEVGPGKPEPDVYLEAARRLGTEPQHCAAIEDSGNGIRAALAAGMRVVAIPDSDYPPDREILDRADVELVTIADLTADTIDRLSVTS